MNAILSTIAWIIGAYLVGAFIGGFVYAMAQLLALV